MNVLMLSVLFLAFIWGCIFAAFLQFTALGRWLCNRRTYITVIIGVGADLGIMALFIPLEYVLSALVILALSAIGIIARSIVNELAEHRELEQINAKAPDQRH